MRKDTGFSEKKLTRKEFSDKYWLNGEVPYQYHSADIEDGRDEREQFVFNNCKALFNICNNYREEAERANEWLENRITKKIRYSVLLYLIIIIFMLMHKK